MRFAAHWGEATLRAIRDVAPTIRVFDLVPQAGHLLPFAPGAHLDIGVMVNGQPETRSYSLIGETGGDSYRIGVRRRADSRGGSDYLWSLAPGARLAITAPKSAFTLDFEHSEFLLVAGGIGITPLIGMAGLLKRRGARLRLLHAARQRADLGFEAELGTLLGVDYVPMLSEEGRRIDLGAEFARLAPDALCALCGPMPMLDAARRLWAAAGRPAANLRWETFGSSGRLGAEDFRVRVPRHGVDLVVPRTMTLLDALERAGIGVISDCRRGECGLCAMDVLAVQGEIDHRDVFFSDHEKAANGRICACVSRATGTLTLDSDYRPDAI
jgi:vanillate O-demethylase ferredoxin subunit